MTASSPILWSGTIRRLRPGQEMLPMPAAVSEGSSCIGVAHAVAGPAGLELWESSGYWVSLSAVL